MAFIRKRGQSFYLVHNVRQKGRVRQIHLACLGRRPRIGEDLIRGVASKHPFLRLNWEGLKEKASRDLVQPFENDSQFLRDLLGSVRNLHFDIADLQWPVLDIAGNPELKAQLVSELKLLRTTLDVKLGQRRRPRGLSLPN